MSTFRGAALLPVMQAYFEGDLNEHKDKIERCYRAKYEALGEDGIDDDPEDDDGRYDAWA